MTYIIPYDKDSELTGRANKTNLWAHTDISENYKTITK